MHSLLSFFINNIEIVEEKVLTHSLFFISERSKDDFISMNNHSIEHLFDNNKDDMFSNYCKSFIVDKEMVGKYLKGLETNMVFWLIDSFQQI